LEVSMKSPFRKSTGTQHVYLSCTMLRKRTGRIPDPATYWIEGDLNVSRLGNIRQSPGNNGLIKSSRVCCAFGGEQGDGDREKILSRYPTKNRISSNICPEGMNSLTY